MLAKRGATSTVALLLAVAALAGCSSTGLHVEFVSPDQYQGLTCQEIGAEGERVARQVAQITGAEPNGTDLSIAGQPIVVLWPSPLVELSEENSKELARLKGQFEALDEASRRKRCSYSFKQQQA